MKKILIISLAACLLAAIPAVSYGAIHSSKEDFTIGSDFGINYFININSAIAKEEWFTVKKTPSYLLGCIDYSDFTQNYGVYYFKNNQTFAEIDDFSTGVVSLLNVKGSYLFDFGLFAGLNYYSGNSWEYALLAAGYRYDLAGDGFLALSVDYDPINSEMYGVDLDGEYYLDRAKLTGQLYVPQSGDAAVTLGGNYQIDNNLVCGLRLDRLEDEIFYTAGLTWKKENLILNGKLGKDFVLDNYAALGLGYRINKQFSAGADITKYRDSADPFYALKVKYSTESFIINFNLLINNPGTP